MSGALRAVSVIALLAAGSSGHAQSSLTVDTVDWPGMALSLGLVVGLILAAAYFFKRAPFGLAGRGEGPLRVVASIALGPRERLLLVSARGREILVGVSPAGVSVADVDRGRGAGLVDPVADAPQRPVGEAPRDAAALAASFGSEPSA